MSNYAARRAGFLLGATAALLASPAHAQKVTVVNMIPPSLSDETNQDSEPFIAVNPATPVHMAASAFTPDPMGGSIAPIFVSTDGGTTWSLNTIVPSNWERTADITLRFGGAGGNLYAAILKGTLDLSISRTASFLGPQAMAVLHEQSSGDQPYIQASPGGGVERIYVGENDVGVPGSGTAAILQSLNAAQVNPSIQPIALEHRTAPGFDGPQIRPAVHADGTVYALFYGYRTWTSGTATSDIVVMRDDGWGAGPSPFTALVDPGDNKVGRLVATNRVIPWSGNLGQNRLGGTNAIAVDPNKSSTVYIAWADRVGADDYTLHVRRSLDRGVTWSTDLRTIANATNPSLAINTHGVVGFLYQRLVQMGGGPRWVTHFERTTDGFQHVKDVILANVPADQPPKEFDPYIGDYAHVMAVGDYFYGVFSANNTPDAANFPEGVTYQRNADFDAQTLLANDHTTPVAVSIDPFFFKLRAGSMRFWPGRIIFECDLLPCGLLDKLDKNCWVKMPCPPIDGPFIYYHLVLEGLDGVWRVTLLDAAGNEVPHERVATGRGVVLSFRPDARRHPDNPLEGYALLFEMGSAGKLQTEYEVKVRLDVGRGPYRPPEVRRPR